MFAMRRMSGGGGSGGANPFNVGKSKAQVYEKGDKTNRITFKDVAGQAEAKQEVEEIVEAQWKDLGMPETLWHCHVKEFGPLIVSIDSYGRNYFEEKKVEYNQKKDEQIEIISKQVGFIK